MDGGVVGGGGVGCWGWGDRCWGVVGGGGGGGWWGVVGWWMVVGGVLGAGICGGGVGCCDGGGCWRVVGQGHFFPLLSCQAAFQQPKIRTKKYEFVLLKFVLFCTNPFIRVCSLSHFFVRIFEKYEFVLFCTNSVLVRRSAL